MWTNPSPTSAFNNGTNLNLSQSIEDFKYIAIYTNATTSNSTETITIYPISFVKSTTNGLNYNSTKMAVGCTPSTSAYCARYFIFISNTIIQAFRTIYVADNGTVSTPFTIAIPTKIVGLK